MFIHLTKANKNSVVATIAGQVNMPDGISTVKWSWINDLGEFHTHLVEHVYFFPSSPINILGVTAFAHQLADEEFTGVDTKWKTSTFYWKGGYKKTIQHPIIQLPEMALAQVNDSQFAHFIGNFSTKIDDNVSFHHASCHSCTETVTIPPDDFRCQDIEIDDFVVGERLFYANDGHNCMVIVKDIKQLEDGMKILTVELPNKKLIDTTPGCLRPPSQPDIASIPITQEDYSTKSQHLSAKDCDHIANPTVLSPEQQELMSYHNHLYHLPFSILIQMASFGLIPKRLSQL